MEHNSFHCNALSLSRLRRQLPPGGSLYATTAFSEAREYLKNDPKFEKHEPLRLAAERMFETQGIL